MSIFYPDVSNHQGGMALENGTVAVCAKASEGTGYTDPYYGHYKSEAARVGAVFFGYHFLHAGNAAKQAQNCFGATGRGMNVMVDLEPIMNQNSSYASKPTLDDCLGFVQQLRSMGGLCTLVYLPDWYYLDLGEPSLEPLTAAGLSLVSSDYTTYLDNGAGWEPYYAGGPVPAVWQYTETLSYSGQKVDFNAYRGTVEQFKTLLGYSTLPAPQVPINLEDDMATLYICPRTPAGPDDVFKLEDGKYLHIPGDGDVSYGNMVKAGMRVVPISYEYHLTQLAAYDGTAAV